LQRKIDNHDIDFKKTVKIDLNSET